VSQRARLVSCRGYWPNPGLRPGEPVTLDTYAGDLAQFIRALDAGPVHLVGHSSPGGFGSLLLACRHPELLRTLVLLEPPAFPLLGVSIPPRPAQLITLLIRHPRAGLGFIRFGAKGIGPAITAFERGDDAQALRVFMAANTSQAAVDAIPQAIFQRFLDNAGPLKAQLKAGFPRSPPPMPGHQRAGPAGLRRGLTRAPPGGHRPPGHAAARCGPADHRRGNPQHVHQPPRTVQRRRAAVHPVAQRR